ncbi:MAG: zinc ribbon domain-containing protein [Thermoflexales bacterium]|nr:zinc ribbon domain-containing protein [Thermoflexales bacterium]MBP8241140.1 zinc ribbon domain-containing protein [Thermoflexales bacterium]
MTELLAAANNLIVAAVSIIGAITAALVGGITIWTFRDIRSRTRDILAQILATVMVGVVPIAGLVVYFLLRPRETLSEAYVRALEEESLLTSIESQEFCPTCGRRVDADMQFCPSCHDTLRKGCPNCGRALHLAWDLCPYCGSETGAPAEVSHPARKSVNQPRPRPAVAARATAPSRPTQAPKPALQAPAGTGASSGIGALFDRIGGAVEGVLDRTRSSPPSAAPEAGPADPPPAARRALPRSQQPAPPPDDTLE